VASASVRAGRESATRGCAANRTSIAPTAWKASWTVARSSPGCKSAVQKAASAAVARVWTARSLAAREVPAPGRSRTARIPAIAARKSSSTWTSASGSAARTEPSRLRTATAARPARTPADSAQPATAGGRLRPPQRGTCHHPRDKIVRRGHHADHEKQHRDQARAERVVYRRRLSRHGRGALERVAAEHQQRPLHAGCTRSTGTEPRRPAS
jgi:hypothetical protein